MRNKVSRERRRIRKEILIIALTYVNEDTTFYTCNKLADINWFKDVNQLVNDLTQNNSLKKIDTALVNEKFIQKTSVVITDHKTFCFAFTDQDNIVLARHNNSDKEFVSSIHKTEDLLNAFNTITSNIKIGLSSLDFLVAAFKSGITISNYLNLRLWHRSNDNLTILYFNTTKEDKNKKNKKEVISKNRTNIDSIKDILNQKDTIAFIKKDKYGSLILLSPEEVNKMIKNDEHNIIPKTAYIIDHYLQEDYSIIVKQENELFVLTRNGSIRHYLCGN